jgi:hypothetical protein
MKTAACFSADRKYRYWLTRSWDDGALPMLCVIGLNPSTADETVDDPTIRKCIGFAERLGFGSLLMLNVGAYRATDPRRWLSAADPFGPENSIAHLREYIAQNTMACREGEIPTKGISAVVAAWGKNGHKTPITTHRCLTIAHAIPDLFCWGRNPDSSPRHPLMLPYSTKLENYREYLW